LAEVVIAIAAITLRSDTNLPKFVTKFSSTKFIYCWDCFATNLSLVASVNSVASIAFVADRAYVVDIIPDFMVAATASTASPALVYSRFCKSCSSTARIQSSTLFLHVVLE
jgi:hypothetical protein